MVNNEQQDDKVFKALAANDRRKMLDLLRDGRLTTGNICQQMSGLSRCSVLQHLKVLAQAGLIIQQKQGRNCWNTLDISPIQGIYQRWIIDYAAPAAGILQQLKQQLEQK